MTSKFEFSKVMSYGKVMLKTTTGLVKEVKSQTDLQNI